MLYTIDHLHRSRIIGRETHRGTLDDASSLAVAAVDHGPADRAEVRDVHGRLAFHHPRTFAL